MFLLSVPPLPPLRLFFFFNDPATTEIYTLSLHDALPISSVPRGPQRGVAAEHEEATQVGILAHQDRKSTRLNSSHSSISYAVFCLKKKKKKQRQHIGRTTTKEQSQHQSTLRHSLAYARII